MKQHLIIIIAHMFTTGSKINAIAANDAVLRLPPIVERDAAITEDKTAGVIEPVLDETPQINLV